MATQQDHYALMTPDELVGHARENPNDGKGIGRIYYGARGRDHATTALHLAHAQKLTQHPIFQELADILDPRADIPDLSFS